MKKISIRQKLVIIILVDTVLNIFRNTISTEIVNCMILLLQAGLRYLFLKLYSKEFRGEKGLQRVIKVIIMIYLIVKCGDAVEAIIRLLI